MHDDFFQLGAHSLLGAQVIARVRGVFGTELKLLDVFDSPTVAELSGKIEEALTRQLSAMSEAEVEAALADFRPEIMARADASLSLVRLLEPEVLANPYPLYRKLREEDPVHWDRFMHTWVVTRYADVINVLHNFSADRTPTPEQLTAMGLHGMNPIAEGHGQADALHGRAGTYAIARAASVPSRRIGCAFCASTFRRSSTNCSTACRRAVRWI